LDDFFNLFCGMRKRFTDADEDISTIENSKKGGQNLVRKSL
jgi:hypothetical protein